MSFQSSPMASPSHHHFQYHCSPIHHSRESSTTRFSASIKNPKTGAWKKMLHETGEEEDEDDDDDGLERHSRMSLPKFYFICFILSFVVLFTAFSLILWGASKPYKPRVSMQSIVFESLNIQAGMDGTGVPTKMLSLNSTVRISFRNTATFFGVHVSSTPITLYYYDLKVASGNMKQFYQSRKSQRMLSAVVQGYQIPLYGGGATLTVSKEHPTAVPLSLTFVIRSRAYVLGKLVKPKFYSTIHCSVTLRQNQLGKRVDMKNSCLYD
ncbi:Late embryogenesis abundant protein [Cinnamomum micranthum f. kanehirae]|uniref:Late embryogenesis abundant protein n=1 Tax=Cinnamomum micranthum f. kanehirae TaxID=337451 RepID=A0A443PIP2_9MAGN|nr:Late embryogenesis abundant protein [Cinnamomum micranthum f. kanehirae]